MRKALAIKRRNAGSVAGAAAFDEYYQQQYGARWPLLRTSLERPACTVAYGEGLVTPYFLDSASILAAEALRLPCRHDDHPLILDACAAPGGKALVIASRMASGAKLLANELSSERRRRLSAVLDKHLPPQLRARVHVSGFDAAAEAGRHSQHRRFAAILLDAPCSSERHVLQSKAALEQWTQARPRFLARRQWALLSAAFLLLADGGSLVYATCALNTAENDGVAAQLLRKYADTGQCMLDPPDFLQGHATAYGRIVLPDTADGAGPLYVARFRKVAIH